MHDKSSSTVQAHDESFTTCHAHAESSSTVRPHDVDCQVHDESSLHDESSSTVMLQVMRRLETPRAICDCMAALVQGDLASKGSLQPNHADNLLPLTPTGRPSPRTRLSFCTTGEPSMIMHNW